MPALFEHLRIRMGKDGLYTYPDVVVVCGQIQVAEKNTVINPRLTVEVLWDSTEGKDRGFKFHQYQHIDTLQEYVLVSQREPRIEVFRRASAGEWQLNQYAGLDAVARFASIECEIPLADIYRIFEGT